MSKRSPRLQFTEEERAAPDLEKAIRKAEKRMDKLEKAEAAIPKKQVKWRVVDPKTGRVTTRLSFEEKKKPPSKLTHALDLAPGETVLAAVHRELRQSEKDNVGVESAHKLEETAEGGARLAHYAHHESRLKPYRTAARAETRADKANLKALYKEAEAQNPQFSSNPYSRWQQKRAIRKEYAAAKAGSGVKNTVKASETTAKAAKRAAEDTKKASAFVARHKKGFLIVGGIAAAVLLLFAGISSCSVLMQGTTGGVGWNFGRLGASGLLGICTRISAAEARPGDLIFFERTYDTTGASHVSIYVGDGMMLHCGDPIQYTSINTSYWQSHFLSFGRLPNP